MSFYIPGKNPGANLILKNLTRKEPRGAPPTLPQPLTKRGQAAGVRLGHSRSCQARRPPRRARQGSRRRSAAEQSPPPQAPTAATPLPAPRPDALQCPPRGPSEPQGPLPSAQPSGAPAGLPRQSSSQEGRAASQTPAGRHRLPSPGGPRDWKPRCRFPARVGGRGRRFAEEKLEEQRGPFLTELTSRVPPHLGTFSEEVKNSFSAKSLF